MGGKLGKLNLELNLGSSKLKYILGMNKQRHSLHQLVMEVNCVWVPVGGNVGARIAQDFKLGPNNVKCHGSYMLCNYIPVRLFGATSNDMLPC